MQDRGDFTIERGEAAFVVANPLPVDPHMGAVISRADVQEGARAGFGLGIKVTLVEDDSFVVEKLGYLGIPVAGNFRERYVKPILFWSFPSSIVEG
jgi:hypothetical protein